MGKSLKELLDIRNAGNFIPTEGSGIPVPVTVPGPQIHGKNYKAMQALVGTKEADIMNADSKYTEEFGKIAISEYGTDATRILSQTDPHEIRKGIKKGADKISSALGGSVIGSVIGAGISKAAEFHPKFPDDWTNDADAPTKMEPNFYYGLINGDYAGGKYYKPYHDNSKSKLGKFLQANKNPEQVKNAIVPALKSAAVAAAVGLVVLGASKLFGNKNKKKGKEGPKLPEKKTPQKRNPAFFNLDQSGKPYFPSTLLINEGFGENGYGLSSRNYSQLRFRNFNIGMTGFYLEKSGDQLLSGVAPTIDYTQLGDADNTHGISSYHGQVLLNNTPQTRNAGNVMVSANMFQNNYEPAYTLDSMLTDAGDDSFGYYTANRKQNAPERAVDDKVQNYSRFVDAEGNAFIVFGKRTSKGVYSDNDINKDASFSLRYGASNVNLLKNIKYPEQGKDPIVEYGGGDLKWAMVGSSYTADLIRNKANTKYAKGKYYANPLINNDTQIKITDEWESGHFSQFFGANTTNLLQIVNGENNHTFDVKTSDGSDRLIAKIKGDYKDNIYTYTKTELDILNVTSEEKSRFITGSIGTNVFFQPGHTSNVETQIGQQFGDSFISVDVDTTDAKQYQFPYKKIGGLETVARWNTKAEPFSKNVNEILKNDLTFVDSAIQTQINVSEQINPYHELKTKILEKNESDIVKVAIGAVNFFATVTNLSDKNTSNWDSVKPIGSGVNFYLFNNWERSISFDLTMYAEHEADLGFIWSKVNKLASFTTGRPSGDTGTAYGTYGNIVELQIGNLIKENGFVSDITMNVDTNSPWEITTGSQLPFVCTISVSFQVVTNLEGNAYSFYNKK